MAEAKLDPSSGRPLIGPLRIEASPEGALFVTDEGQNDHLSEFSAEGNLVDQFDSYGDENISTVTDFVVEGQRLWVADLLGSQIHTLDLETREWDTPRVVSEPYRIEVLGSRLVVMHIGLPLMFDLLNHEGDVVEKYGTMLQDQARYSLALDGFTARAGDQVIFVGKWLGAIASFHGSELRMLVEPLDSPPAPAIMESEHMRWLRHGVIPASFDVAVVADRIVVLTRRQLDFEMRSFVDIYRLSDGMQVRSLVLPKQDRWTSLAVSDHHLFLSGLKAIARWPRGVLVNEAADISGSALAGQPIIPVSFTPQYERTAR